MADVSVILAVGKELGHKGEELKRFVEEQQRIQADQQKFITEQQNEARDQRLLEREKIRAEEEKMKHKEAYRVLEEERLKSERALEEERLKLEREKLKSNEAIEMEKLRLKREELQKEPSETTTLGKIKMSPFDEEKDSFDSYISRFENIARMQKWKREEWADQLSLLLSGKALDTYFSLSDTQQKNYEAVKEALMRTYQLTEEEFRKGFFESGIEKGETIQQFMARLERLFTKWVAASKIPKNYNELKNLLIREGFYQRCEDNLAAYLREKDQTVLDDIVVSAQKYIDAHGGMWGNSNWRLSKQNESVQAQRSDEPPCPVCKKHGHTESKCWFKNNGERRCFRCGSYDHLIKDCKGEKEAVGSSSVLSDNSPVDLQEKYRDLSPDALGNVLRVPMSEGKVNGHKVLVMRDTGFGYAAVKTKFVNKADYIDEYGDVHLLDNTRRKFQKAVVEVETKPFTGKLKVLVVDTLVVDCVIGNIDGLRDNSLNWFNNKVEGGECAGAVITRAQTKALKKPTLELTVDDTPIADRHTFQQLQREDPILGKLWDLVGADDIATKKGKIRFEERKNLLYRIFTPSNGGTGIKQLVVPEKLRQKVISVAHDGLLSGHCGIRRTIDRVCSNFYWKNLQQDVRRFCRSCSVCQKTFQKGRQGKAPLQRMPVISEPFKRIAVDLVGPITPCSERGHRYMLTVMDYATRYPEAEVLKNVDTITVAEALVSIFCRIGFPDEMLTDRGTQFMSEVMKEVNRLLSLKHLKTTAWHPMCNGLVERFNGTLKTILKRLCAESPKQWDRYLPAVLFAYRSSVQESSGFSPFELVFGRKIRGPMEILRAYWGKEEEQEDVKQVYQYVIELRQRLQDTCNIAQEELMKAQEMQKRHYDKSARAKSLKVGEKVIAFAHKGK